MSIFIRVEAYAGSEITDTIDNMINLAERTNTTVVLDFNGVEIVADGGDERDNLVKAYKSDLKAIS